MPQVIIVAGPNGAGKTSFANKFLPIQRRSFSYVNADEIERDLRPKLGLDYRPDLRAGRAMLSEIDEVIAAGGDLMIETTLATRIYVRKIALWRRSGYWIGLNYLRLPSAESAIARVRRRVAGGGHDIPEATIRRRFATSLRYLDELYKPIVDEWYVWDSLEGSFAPVEAWDRA